MMDCCLNFWNRYPQMVERERARRPLDEQGLGSPRYTKYQAYRATVNYKEELDISSDSSYSSELSAATPRPLLGNRRGNNIEEGVIERQPLLANKGIKLWQNRYVIAGASLLSILGIGGCIVLIMDITGDIAKLGAEANIVIKALSLALGVFFVFIVCAGGIIFTRPACHKLLNKE